MKTIKVIDLLNMVFNDELKENALIKFNYDSKGCEYWRYINGGFLLCYDNGKSETDDWIDIMSYLTEKDATVEIIEDKPSKIKEIDTTSDNTLFDIQSYTGIPEQATDWNFKVLKNTVNELVRAVNNLAEREEK